MMTRADRFMLAGAIGLLIWLYASLWGSHLAGESARLRVGNQPSVDVPLNENHRYTLSGPRGDSIIEVSQGRIRFIESPCQGKQCIHSGWLQRDGEFTACIPNRISITVRGRDPRFDTINF